MSFLSKIKFGGSAPTPAPADIEIPARTRIFSATAYREAELAREAEARAHQESIKVEASNVLSPAIAPVAEQLIQEQALHEVDLDETDDDDGAAEAFDAAPYEEPVELTHSVADLVARSTNSDQPSFDPPTVEVIQDPVEDPMPWDEAVGWLSQRSTESRNFVAQYWNWDYDLRVLEFLVRQPDVDAGVAAGIFWLTAATEDHFPWSDEPAMDEISRQVANLTDIIGRRFSDGDFAAMSHGFDDSWDCERLKERLEDLYGESRIEWSPADLPTSSHAPMLGFDDIPEDERAEVVEFLGRFGVR